MKSGISVAVKVCVRFLRDAKEAMARSYGRDSSCPGVWGLALAVMLPSQQT